MASYPEVHTTHTFADGWQCIIFRFGIGFVSSLDGKAFEKVRSIARDSGLDYEKALEASIRHPLGLPRGFYNPEYQETPEGITKLEGFLKALQSEFSQPRVPDAEPSKTLNIQSLREWRKKMGVNQDWVANHLDIPPSSFSRIERGKSKRKLTRSELEKAHAYLTLLEKDKNRK